MYIYIYIYIIDNKLIKFYRNSEFHALRRSSDDWIDVTNCNDFL